MPEKIQVTRVIEEMRPEADGRFTRQVRVEWTYGPHGPFIDHFPLDLDARQARARLEARARELDIMIGT